MARKPKIPPSTEATATVSGQKRAAKDVTPVSVGKGRKPKTAARTPELATAVESGHAVTVGADAGVHAPDTRDTPARGRQGRVPKPTASTPTAPLLQEDAKERRGRKSIQPEAELEPIGDDAPNAEVISPIEIAADSDAAPPVTDLGAPTIEAATSSPSPDTSVPSKPAAHWDRAADTVRFDWPEIERTASQAGPNQGMAKLLVAARAEGANSRWPL